MLKDNGEYIVYDDESKKSQDTRIWISSECKQIEKGSACGSLKLPTDNANINAAFSIKTKNGKDHPYLASSASECK